MQSDNFSRRAFLTAAALAATTSNAAEEPLTNIDFAKLVGRADLTYDQPVPRSEEGIPIGNGRMGSLVWTTPNQLRFQINRVDVYANNSATNSFFERHNDYCGGCAYLDIDFAGAPFPESGFRQHLSLYDGELGVAGKGVNARLLAWPAQDVMAIEVAEGAAAPVATLRMLRYETKYFGQQLEEFVKDHVATVQNRNHTATSRLIVRDDGIALVQEFREGGYCCKSAVAVGVVGRTAKARVRNEMEVEIAAERGSGAATILVASAATFDANEDVAASAFRELAAARAKGFTAISRESREWWHNFWATSYVHLHSDDGTADFVEQNYTYYLYVMASSSRGKFPPKFNGMIFNTGGDLRTWGAQHWFANLSCYYEALPATGRWELMDPMFAMYFGMRDACATAARQQWGTQGIYIPETSYFDGLEKLPDAIANEMRELYLMHKPWAERSAEFMAYALNKHPHSSRWNWIQAGSWVNGKYVLAERGNGPYGAVSHIFGSTAKVAYWYWRRYEFTQDREWLRDRAYPMLRGAVEFYRNYPNMKKGADGKYHLDGANSNESIYGARDTDEDISSMRGIVPALIRASEILDTDADVRPVWREFLSNLPALPTTDDVDALRPENYSGPRTFVRGHKPAVKPGGTLPDGNSLPMWFFDQCNVESRDQRTLETAQNTFRGFFRNGLNAKTAVSVLSKVPIAAASLGNAEAVKITIPNQIRALAPERGTSYKNGGVLANRMTLREGPQALDAQRLGRAAEALHLAMLQSNPTAPAEDPVIHVFPAWPKEWNARYSLFARGAFLVSSSHRNGQVEFVELMSQAGSPCRLRNPFAGGVVLFRDGRKAEALDGSLLQFSTRKGERIVVVSSGKQPGDFHRTVPEG